MSISEELVSTGLAGLDKALKGLIPGDNVVWQVDSVEDYSSFVRPYFDFARSNNKRLIYFRFATHDPLVDEDGYAEVHRVHPEMGFESFLSTIHKVIREAGYGAHYIFDCLSDLVVDWYSDRMLGNFFKLTCPYLYDLRTIAYFGLIKDHHSYHAVKPIMETTQLFLNTFQHEENLYVHPLKVENRYSPTIHTLHMWHKDDFRPVTNSVTISEVLTSGPWSRLESASHRLGPWNSTFQYAEEVMSGLETGERSREEGEDIFKRLLRMAITRNEQLLRLAERYFTLSDIIEIRKRLIGTGLIGGKSVGFLLARKILKESNGNWNEKLEASDSFFVGSDVFYTFLVENDCWWVHQKQKSPETFMEDLDEGQRQMLEGIFPQYIMNSFEDMLDYFGQCPIIVRSSSLQEDNYGNSFVGKYDSVFCPNQGPREKRIEDFLSAVRTIYASTLSEKALRYRERRGILDLDEQMALLIQRVSGDQYGKFFYPQIAGVGLSFNPYVWSEYIKPEAGMLRLVFGLGTRAVDRTDDDYTRIVALNDPVRRPESDFSEVSQHAQRRVDIIELEENRLLSLGFIDVARNSPGLPLEIFTSPDRNAYGTAIKGHGPDVPGILTFDRLLTKTTFVDEMREMLGVLQAAYEYPVDTEFTVNFLDDNVHKINLLQCRPLQVKEGGPVVDPPADIPKERIVFQSNEAVIGYSRSDEIKRIIFVVPEEYSRLTIKERYAMTQALGRINDMYTKGSSGLTILAGPGRWGTASPELGVPAKFAQISRVSVICEIVAMRSDLVPDVSLGTHFLNELVEADMLYFALFPNHKGSILNKDFLEKSPNRLGELLPDDEKWSNVIRVIEPSTFLSNTTLCLNANALKQRVVCYIEQ